MRAPWVIFRVLFLLLGGASALHAADRAYWVWQRPDALTESESAELRRQGVTVLYWQVAALGEDHEVRVVARDVAKLAPGFHLIPAVRVETRLLPPAADWAGLARLAVDGALQIDFDCVDRELPAYAGQLAKLRETVPHLGITALAHWPSVKGFPALARSVEELCPMFYDLQSDPSDVSAANPPPPLLDPEPAAKLIAAWHGCPTRWRAGLPVFTRLSVFAADGVPRGQIPAWEWDEIAFQKHLRTLAPTRLGVTFLRADAETVLARRKLKEGDLLAVRQTDLAALAACSAAAAKEGADGLVLFRLPSADSDATWSLRALGGDAQAAPHLALQSDGDALVLVNDGPADLPPRLAGEKHDRDRGYTLELDAPAAIFREAMPGAFFRVGAHVHPDHEPQAAAVPTATRLTFWFSHLPAGARLRSGLFQLAPAADPAALRWRAAGGAWQPLPSLHHE